MPEDEWALVARVASLIFDGEQRIQRAWRDPSFPFRGVPHAIPRTREPVEIPSADRGRLVLDCPRSRAGRPRLWDYHSVEMRTVDIERLAQEAITPTPQPPRAARTADAVHRDAKTVIAPRRRTYSRIDLGRVDLTGDIAAAPARQEEAAPGAAPAAANTPVSESQPEQPPQSAASVAETLAPEASALVREVAAALRKKWPEGRPKMTVYQILESLHTDYPKTKIGVCGKTTLERALRYLKEQGQPGW